MTAPKPPSWQILLLLRALLIVALVLLPLILSNHPKGALAGMLVLVIIFFFPGYVLLSVLQTTGGLRIIPSFVVGIVIVTTAYSLAVSVSIGIHFLYFVLAVSCAGILLFFRQLRRAPASKDWHAADYESLIAGAAVSLSVAPLYWRSGRFVGDDFVFYGPAGQDPLFHVTLIQRLLHHVPPDNFILSGFQPPVYHYFDDLTLALTLNAQKAFHLGSTDLLDLFYRCYPTIIYFLLGALAYRLGRQLLGTLTGGILGTFLLLGGGGLGWIFGILQTLSHASHLIAARSWLFSEWTSWDGVDPILPLVHRPAHYHSLLICLTVFNLLLRPERSRRDWIMSGLLLGLMAGFNFTLAATFGISAVVSWFLLWVRGDHIEARELAWLAVSIFFGSLPMLATMVLSGRHNSTPGFPFRGPNLQFTTGIWAPLLHRVVGGFLLPLAALILFPIVAYGIRLAGIPEMFRCQIAGVRHRGIALVLVIVFVLSFGIGAFFPYKSLGGIAVVFIQPTLWILGIFSLHPIGVWLERNHGNWRYVMLWGMFVLIWIQALTAFNLGDKASFSRGTVGVFSEIRSKASPDDVVAYMPSSLSHVPVLGQAGESTNFAITALTGLDGYVSSESYSIAFAVPDLRGSSEAEIVGEAERIYEQRRHDIDSFVRGDVSGAAPDRLLRDHVRWVVVPAHGLIQGPSSPRPWRSSSEVVVYQLSP